MSTHSYKINNTFGLGIKKDVVCRILTKYYKLPSNDYDALKKNFESEKHIAYYPALPNTDKKVDCLFIILNNKAKLTIMDFFADINKLVPDDCVCTSATESKMGIENTIKITGFNSLRKIFDSLKKRNLINGVNEAYFLARINPAQAIGVELNKYLARPLPKKEEVETVARKLATSLKNYSINYCGYHTEKMYLFMESKNNSQHEITRKMSSSRIG